MFNRDIEQKVLDNLQKSDLWKKQLKDDCTKQELFLAIRPNNEVSFYHKGGKLFGFDEKNGFKTHIKYAAVIDDTSDYLIENELKTKLLISDFINKYDRIKENCNIYSGVEAQGVSEIYHKHSYLSEKDIVVLDIEVMFGQNDKIDVLLYNKTSKTLKFVEAKHFSNPEIWSKTIPKVVSQIRRYKKQIETNESEIIKAYKKHINIINEIFGKSIPLPEKLENDIALLIFGFDRDQEKGRLKMLKSALKEQNIKVYCAGNAENANLNALWNK